MMSTVTAILADDEALLRGHLREKLAALWPELTIVAEAVNGLEAAEMIAALKPDIAFLDIKMPGRTGIEVAQEIETDTRVVFVTAFDQYAVQAFDSEAIDYVLKPVSNDRLQQTVARLRTALAQSAPAPEISHILNLLSRGAATAAGKKALRWIRASRGDTTFQISVDEVLFFQSDDKYTAVHTVNGEYLIGKTLAELIVSLDEEQFWQVHRGCVVNLHHVTSSKRDDEGKLSLAVKGYPKRVSVSRAYQHLFKHM